MAEESNPNTGESTESIWPEPITGEMTRASYVAHLHTRLSIFSRIELEGLPEDERLGAGDWWEQFVAFMSLED